MSDDVNRDLANSLIRQAAKNGAKVKGGGRPKPAPVDDDTTDTLDGLGLPENCPVTPLGLLGQTRFYLDCQKQLIALDAGDHSRQRLVGLFGEKLDFLYTVKRWTRRNTEGMVTGIRPEHIAEDLIKACGRRGIWDPTNRERGRGAWRGDDGELVLHTGNQVMTFGRHDPIGLRQVAPAGLLGRYVYPAAEPIPAPTFDDDDVDRVAELFRVVQTWNWRRTDLDAVLLLGWVGAAMIGGALDWRPSCWMTGGKGTGKSTLQAILRQVLGAGVLALEDTSGAGVWQTLGQQTLPVAVDEMEASDDNRRALQVIALARLAASGGKMARGSDRHTSVQFQLRSCFMFSSVLVPPMMGPDRSRLAFLELDELDPTAPEPNFDAKKSRAVGEQMRKRLVLGWKRFEATLKWWRDALTKAGHTKRTTDTFGTLLACADLVLWPDGTNEDQADEWLSRMQSADLAETVDDVRDEQQCLDHLLAQFIDPYRSGEKYTIGEWIHRAAGQSADVSMDTGKQQDAQRVLQSYGIRYELILPQYAGAQPAKWIAIANAHSSLAQLFERTRWGAPRGITGVWTQALRRLPGAERSGRTLYFGGPSCRATLLPLQLIPRPALPHDKPVNPFDPE
jgi:hypothetical protein